MLTLRVPEIRTAVVSGWVEGVKSQVRAVPGPPDIADHPSMIESTEPYTTTPMDHSELVDHEACATVLASEVVSTLYQTDV